jgi:hypothetical protein
VRTGRPGTRCWRRCSSLRLVARMLRRFLLTSVDELTAAGIRQFLDIGTGLPTADNTHDVAQRAAPECCISSSTPKTRTG